MKKRVLAVPVLLGALLVGCMNPTKPEVFAIDGTAPFNKAMAAVIQSDAFLQETLRPGFSADSDGVPESYIVSPDEEGSRAIEHLLLMTERWCGQQGGKLSTYPEIAVLQRGVGNVVQALQNRPVMGNAKNLVCYQGREALGAAAIGRHAYFLNAAQFRRAMSEAGSSIIEFHTR